MGTLSHMPPRGRYLAAEVGRLAGVSGAKIGQWARQGYIKSSQGTGRPRVYSYQDVAEAMVVHQLLDSGVSYKRIRLTLDELRKDSVLGDWPLSQVDFATVGSGDRPEVVVQRDGGHFDLTGRPWNGMIDAGDLRRIAADLNRGGWAAREMPDLKYIEVHPDLLSGRPVVRGHRIAARSAAELAETERGLAVLRDEYELDDAEIHDAQRWWRVARRYEAA
ncbi:MAG TPA: MerR family transcriptional regulator [Solirubrobacteraceae bacterium]|nr:MerR family transcriptional regulator [Solirubrobacteraceae bacterium]